jgi:hypothetical protein
MLRLASDADANGDILHGLLARLPGLDLVRAVDALPEGAHDTVILEWAAGEDRVLITNDRKTMVPFAYQRVAEGKPVPGLIVTTLTQPVGAAIEDLVLIAEYFPPEDVRDQIVIYLPFRG